MKPFYVLIIVFVLAVAGTYFLNGVWDVQFSGRIAMCVMLLFTALGHFKFPDGMAQMMPPSVPFRKGLVLASGLFEIAAGICFVIQGTHEITSWLLVGFFVISLPLNIYAAMSRLNYEKGTKGGPGPAYLWFRVPLQILFVAWVLWF